MRNDWQATQPARFPGQRPRRVGFVTDQWGYGPVVMAMAVAEELRGEAIRVYVGQGPGFELSRRASYERMVHIDAMADPVTEQLEAALLSCDVVVSVMNTRVARWAVQCGIPCVYVDSLLWMWGAPPAVPPGVKYFDEDWPGSAARLAEWRPHFHDPEIVGPLVRPPERERADGADPDVVMINLGGLWCPLVDADTLLLYADTMVRCALAAVDRWTGRVVFTAGRHVIDRLDRGALRAIRSDVEIVDLSHDAYVAELARAELLISSAGTHAIFEACAHGVPAIYVPGQNVSQVLCLETLEREAVVSQPLDWGQLYGLNDLDPADEPTACARIAEAIHRLAGDAAARDAVTTHLRASMEADQLRDLSRRQRRFLQSLGPPGAARIATYIIDLLRWSGLEPAS
jgi:hypothetical protein